MCSLTKNHLRYGFLLTGVLALGACSQSAQMQNANRAAAEDERGEDLVVADQGGLKGDESQLSPLEAHLRARQKVNPNNTTSPSPYTRKGHLPNGEVNFSTTRVAENQAPLLDELDGVPIPGHKPEQAAPVAPSPEFTPAQELPRMAGVQVEPSALETADIDPASGQAQESRSLPAYPKGGAQVQDVRLGDHPGKTRLVLDLSSASGFASSVDNNAMILSIELPSAGWDTALQRTFGGHPLFQSYKVISMPSGGTRIEIVLKQPVRVITSMALKPNEIYGDRIFFDVAPAT
jgi:N-acetylmuramoyl-L-alanine amidase